jgi:hypothetical protein
LAAPERLHRVLVPAAAVLVAASAWAAAPAFSMSPYVPRAVSFSMGVRDAAQSRAAESGARAAAGPVSTPVLHAPKRFDLFGLRWRGPVRARVEVRARLASGRWTRWDAADPAVDVPDGSPPVPGTEPIWVGGADALQLRLPQSLHGVRVHFVNSTGTATAADRRQTRVLDAAHSAFAVLAGPAHAAVPAPGGQPQVIPRSAWAGGQCRPRRTPRHGTVKLAFVHHTDNLNGYGPGQSAAMVLAICQFHRNTNGWDDIGYNFLVDRYGQIFEGRAGGIDQPIVGSQVKGFNTVSTGIANLGTFVSQSQTNAGMRALAQVLAWKLTLHGVAPIGRVRLVTPEPDLNGKPKGTVLHLNRIAGHRDANSTDCPGGALYADLPNLRRRVAGLTAPLNSVSLSAAPAPAVYGAPVVLSGRVARARGTSLAGVPVAVQRLTGGTFSTLATTTTATNGSWVASVAVARNGTWRALYAGDRAHASAVSPRIAVDVAPALALAPLAAAVHPGQAFTVSGTIAPAKPRLTVLLERRIGGRFRVGARRAVALVGAGFATTLRARAAGRYRVRVAFAGDAANVPTSASAPLAVAG